MTTNEINIEATVDTDCPCSNGCRCAPDRVIDYADVAVESGRHAIVWASSLTVLGLGAVGLHASWADSGMTWLANVTLDQIVTAGIAVGIVIGLITALVMGLRVRRSRQTGGDQ